GWQESCAAALVRLRLAHYENRSVRNTRMFRRAPPGKSRHRQVEASPEKMNRAAFADEPRPESPHHAVGLGQREPEAVRLIAVVRRMFEVLLERDRVFDFGRPGQDADLDVEGA